MASYKVRRNILGKGGGRFGGVSNYTDFNTAGRQTMAGTARIYRDIWIPPTAFYALEPNGFALPYTATAVAAGSTPTVNPWQIAAGEAAASPYLIPVLSASTAENLDARAWTTFFAPQDAASSISPSVILYYTTRLDMATTGSMEVWRLHYNYWGTSGSAVGGSSGSILYGASMSTTGSGALEVKTLGAIAPFVTASPFVALQLTLENSNASAMAGSPEEVIFGMRIRYAAENLGPTT